MKCKCGNTIGYNRRALGIDTCLECGEKDAQKEIQAKSQRIGVAYNKGGLIYLGAPDVAKQTLRDTMGAQGRSTANLLSDQDRLRGEAVLQPIPVTTTAKPVSRHRKSIGCMWISGDPVAIFDRNDPRIKTAERHVFFTQQSVRQNGRIRNSGAKP